MTTTTIFSEDHLTRMSEALTGPSGLTGTEIGTFLLRLQMVDLGAGVSKKARLCHALRKRQERDASGHGPLAFIQATMEPSRYRGTAQLFELRRRLLNAVLREADLEVAEDGKVRKTAGTETNTDPNAKFSHFKLEIEQNALHPQVAQLLLHDLQDQSYFRIASHLVQSLSQRIRSISGLTCDGAELVDRAFASSPGGRPPLVSLRSLTTDGAWSEQSSFIGLTKGFIETFPSSHAHTPMIPWALSERDLMDLACLASFLHRKLDHALKHRPQRDLPMSCNHR